ncbi:NUDIX hydrolase [Kineococcus rhizosphaerae]|uniref:8-oxo-dGTP diphosphatase n=1 Tax=Kineococcus rhizosphaerae TaxID=559628 RepID=A0A2T0QY66_9ACTN|nr:NUDIX hydrolase [Kineococcus rhizosphaerae]PRY11137.1 8-oxo-dGTP diphosphatase [Kineococcus rhizosphaerae]
MDVEAAGCVVVRAGEQGPEVLLVHRPTTATRTADWSWPKGKLDRLDDGWEHPAVAAVRETAEETGVRVHLGVPLPEQRYEIAGGLRKRVRYWLAHPAGPADPEVFEPADPGEITGTGWFTLDAARDRLSYPADVQTLDAALPGGELPIPTWPLVVLRHARAVKRSDWSGGEAVRPLLEAGHAQSRDLAPLLGCFDVRALVTSPWARCVQTVLPAAELTGLPVEEEPALTEDAFRADADAATDVVRALLDAGRAVVVCSHGPVLPALQAVLAERSDRAGVRRRVGAKLDKAALVVGHVTGSGAGARLVAVERHSF